MSSRVGYLYVPLPQKRTIKNAQSSKSKQSTKSDVFIVEWRLLFAISQFWRLKFDRNPLVDYKLNIIFKMLDGFRWRLSLQNSRVAQDIS